MTLGRFSIGDAAALFVATGRADRALRAGDRARYQRLEVVVVLAIWKLAIPSRGSHARYLWARTG